MSFTRLTTTQKVFLENYLRGTGRSITEAQARSTYGIKNLRARLTEFRQAGLRVVRVPTQTTGRSAWRVSRRDQEGLQGRRFV